MTHYSVDLVLRFLPDVARLALHARTSKVYIGVGRQLFAWNGNRCELIAEFPSTVRALGGSMLHTRTRIVVMLEQGVAIVWDEYGGPRVELFGTELFSPAAVLNLRGWLAVANQRECQVYGMEAERLVLIASGPGPQAPPVALVRTDHIDQFALLDESGAVMVFSVR